MVRTAGIVLVALASAAITLGTPLCCLLGTGCCGATPARAEKAKPRGCPHCKTDAPEKPAGKPCPKADGCKCKSDVTGHAPVADHAPFVAVADVPSSALPAPAAAPSPEAAHRALPPSPSRGSLPLLL